LTDGHIGRSHVKRSSAYSNDASTTEGRPAIHGALPSTLGELRMSNAPIMVPGYTRTFPLHGKVQSFAESDIFRWIVYVAIFINAIVLGVEVEAQKGSLLRDICWNMDAFLTFFFVFECAVKIYVCGHGYFSYKSHLQIWNILEFTTAALSCVYLGMETTGATRVFTNTALCLKMARLGRLIRLCQLRKELMVIVEGFTSSITSLFWVAVVCFVITYGATVFCTSTIGTSEKYPPDPRFDNKELFGGISTTMLTLFSILVLDGWGEVVRPIYKVQPLLVWFFVSFTVIMTFGMMNVVVGIIVETIARVQNKHRLRDASKKNKEEMALFQSILSAMKNYRNSNSSSFATFTSSEDGFTEAEFVQFAQTGDIQELMSRFDFPHHFQVSDIYQMLNDKALDEVVSEEFVTSMFRLINSNDFQRTCWLHLGINSIKKIVISEIQSLREDLDRLHEGELRSLSKKKTSSQKKQPPSSKPKHESDEFDAEPIKVEEDLRVNSRTMHPKTDSKPRINSPKDPHSLSRQKLSPEELLDPLRTATLTHCEEEVSKAKRAVEVQDLLGKTPGLPGPYWTSAKPDFSREEEMFLVWAKLHEAVQNRDSSKIRRWVHHAENVGIEDSYLELERAYGEKLARNSRGAWASAQRVVNTIDRKEFAHAAEVFVEACVTRGAQKSDLLGSLTGLLRESAGNTVPDASHEPGDTVGI